MIKTMDFTGKSEEDAVAAGLKQLGLERDEVSVEIIERAKSGFLGIGSSPAVVRLSFETPDEPEIEEKPAPAPEKKPEPVREKKPERKPEKKHEPAPAPAATPEKKAAPAAEQSGELSPRAQKTGEFLRGLFARMDVEAEPSITEDENGIRVVLTGSDPGALIGRRGETLDAIQHLANYVVNRGSSGRTRIMIDAENYRERRNEALERLAAKTAAKAVKYRRNMTLEPMNAYERHVIHTALQGVEHITTYSVGTDPNRRVVVAYERGSGKDSGRDGGRGYREDRQRSRRREPVEREETPEVTPVVTETPNYREWS